MTEVGVQAERTLLAWRRTGLSVWALGALAVKTMVGSDVATLVAAFVLLLVCTALLAGHERRLQRRAGRLLAEPPAAISVVALTSGCLLVALLAVVGVLVGP